MRSKLRMISSILFCALLLAFFVPANQVQASESIVSPSDFDDLDGDAKYLGEKYRDNYYLDIQECGVLETGWEILNGIANCLFTVIRWLAYLTVALFYYSMDFDVTSMLSSQINSIQEALNSSIFHPLFYVACAFCFCTLLTKFVKQDAVGSALELGKILLITILSLFVVQKSDVALSYATDLTKSIGVEALISVNDSMGLSSDTSEFAAQAAGVLWVDLVHEPWKSVEFIGMKSKQYENDVEEFLNKQKNSDKRNDLIQSYIDDGKTCFDVKVGIERIGFLLVYLMPFLAKCGVFLLVAGAQLVFQLMAVFFLILAPIVLILYVIPSYESVLGIWFRKMLEAQVMILVITLMLAILIRIDMFTFSLSDTYGWFIVLLFQIILGAGLFLSRKKIFNMFNSVQKGVTMPRYALNRMKMAGNMGDYASLMRNSAIMKNNIGKTWNGAVKTGNWIADHGPVTMREAPPKKGKPIYQPSEGERITEKANSAANLQNIVYLNSARQKYSTSKEVKKIQPAAIQKKVMHVSHEGVSVKRKIQENTVNQGRRLESLGIKKESLRNSTDRERPIIQEPAQVRSEAVKGPIRDENRPIDKTPKDKPRMQKEGLTASSGTIQQQSSRPALKTETVGAVVSIKKKEGAKNVSHKHEKKERPRFERR